MTTWWKSRVPCPDCGVLVSISAEGCFCLNEVCERVWIPNPYMAELDAAHVQETARAALAGVPPTDHLCDYEPGEEGQWTCVTCDVPPPETCACGSLYEHCGHHDAPPPERQDP